MDRRGDRRDRSGRPLTEGLRAGDLRDLVLPMISVDEYQSKVSDDAVVFGFYVRDKDAADDLNRFLQKSPVTVLDTDVSTAPDQRGYYIVFVELLDNDRTADNLQSILTEMEPLVTISDWSMHLRATVSVADFTPAALRTHLAASKAKAKRHGPGKGKNEGKPDAKPSSAATLEGAVLRFLTPSDLHGARLDGRQLTLEGRNAALHYEVVALGDAATAWTNTHLVSEGFSLDLAAVAKSRLVAGLLGTDWAVDIVGQHTLLSHDDVTLMLR